MTAHAKLSASGAHRWINCAGSLKAEEAFPDTSSSYADEGTAAHHLAESALTADKNASDFIGRGIAVCKSGNLVEWLQGSGYPDDTRFFTVTQEMADHVQTYLDYVRALPAEVSFIETRVDFSRWVSEGFGTCDHGAVAERVAYVSDLKFGQGEKVIAENNPQLMLYALGFLDAIEGIYDDVETFRLAIIQPRLDHISEWEISRADLLAFGEQAREAAQRALAGDGPLVPGEKQCRFCKARRHCSARAEANLRVAAAEFAADFRLRHPDTFDCVGLAELLPYLDDLKKWAGEMQERALRELLQGNQVPGWKVVEGRSVRTWADEDAAASAMRESGVPLEALYKRKLIGIGDAEKLVGKKHEIFARLTVKPEGKPTLAPAADPRPELKKSAAQDFADVDDAA